MLSRSKLLSRALKVTILLAIFIMPLSAYADTPTETAADQCIAQGSLNVSTSDDSFDESINLYNWFSENPRCKSEGDTVNAHFSIGSYAKPPTNSGPFADHQLSDIKVYAKLLKPIDSTEPVGSDGYTLIHEHKDSIEMTADVSYNFEIPIKLPKLSELYMAAISVRAEGTITYNGNSVKRVTSKLQFSDLDDLDPNSTTTTVVGDTSTTAAPTTTVVGDTTTTTAQPASCAVSKSLTTYTSTAGNDDTLYMSNWYEKNPRCAKEGDEVNLLFSLSSGSFRKYDNGLTFTDIKVYSKSILPVGSTATADPDGYTLIHESKGPVNISDETPYMFEIHTKALKQNELFAAALGFRAEATFNYDGNSYTYKTNPTTITELDDLDPTVSTTTTVVGDTSTTVSDPSTSVAQTTTPIVVKGTQITQGTLPFTGSSSMFLVWVALVLIALGYAANLFIKHSARRKRIHSFYDEENDLQL